MLSEYTLLFDPFCGIGGIGKKFNALKKVIASTFIQYTMVEQSKVMPLSHTPQIWLQLPPDWIKSLNLTCDDHMVCTVIDGKLVCLKVDIPKAPWENNPSG